MADRTTDSRWTIVPFRDDLQPAFEQLNLQWIEQYFVVEPPDREYLSDPRGKIIERGGEVFFVLEGGEVQGTCAILNLGDGEYEIAKMAVAPAARGRGFGDRLMEATVAFARERGGKRVIIVSNTVLAPAITLYRKHGFVEVPGFTDPRYQRANIKLVLPLEAAESSAPSLSGRRP